MRYCCLTLAGALLASAPLLAQQGQSPPAAVPQQQQPAAAPVLDPAHNELDAMLLRWEKEMTAVQALAAQCIRTETDKVLQLSGKPEIKVFEGTAQYMKPNLAMLSMQKKDNPQVFEKYLCTGTFLYEYRPNAKLIVVHEMPPPKPGQVADDNFLSFMFGMKAVEAKRRYEMKLVGKDQNYVYLEIVPRFQEDKAEFQLARLVLSTQTFLPRQLWFKQPNDNEVKWDIPRIDGAARIDRRDFAQPTVPPGWNMVKEQRQPAEVKPRVVRPNQ